LIFALAAGLAFEVSVFSDSRPFMTVLSLFILVGLFFLARTNSFHVRNPAMTDRTRAQTALLFAAFLVAGLIGTWFGSKWSSIPLWSLSLAASIGLGREYADK
jgi:uncharacterized membrane protein